MNFLEALQAKPNQAFQGFELTEPESLTLSIGQDCINYCNGNVKKALAKFSIHSTEIVLTDLYNSISKQPEPDPKIFNNILVLIDFHDQNFKTI